MRPELGRMPKTSKRQTVGKKSRKRRILMFCGFIIAISTFLIKDAMREHLKDLSDSINAAEREYSLSESLDVISLQFVELHYEIISLSPKPAGPNLMASTMARNILTTVDAQAAASYQRLDELLDKLPGRQAFDSYMDSAKKQIDEAHEQVQDTLKKLATDSKYQQDIVGEVVLPILQSARSLIAGLKVTLLGDSVLTVAKKLRDRIEQRYALCTRLSYVLYPLGLILGLIGGFSGETSGPTSE